MLCCTLTRPSEELALQFYGQGHKTVRQNVNINLTNTKTVINAHHKSIGDIIICSSYLVQDQTNALRRTYTSILHRGCKKENDSHRSSSIFKEGGAVHQKQVCWTHIKNCEPLVSFPLFAIDSRNSLVCFIEKLSSGQRKCQNIEITVVIDN